MKRLANLALIVAVGLGILLSALPAQAEDGTRIWKKAEQRLRSMKDYTLLIDYTGPKGVFKYEYACVRPDAIKTKIVQGDKAGAILIYRPSEFGQTVKARKGIMGKSINLDDPTVANTPVIKPVYDMLMDAAKGASNVTLKGEETIYGHAVAVLEITSPKLGVMTVAVDKASNDVLRWVYRDNGGEYHRTFYDIKVNVAPRINF